MRSANFDFLRVYGNHLVLSEALAERCFRDDFSTAIFKLDTRKNLARSGIS
ncbi:MAG: hypothetical protein R3D70_16555 [Rhizobiaceae bacterium]